MLTSTGYYDEKMIKLHSYSASVLSDYRRALKALLWMGRLCAI